MQKNFIKDIVDNYGVDGIFELMNVDSVEAIQALVEIGIIDLERFEQYFNEEQDDEG